MFDKKKRKEKNVTAIPYLGSYPNKSIETVSIETYFKNVAD